MSCYALDSVGSSGGDAGGFVGWNDGEIRYCYSDVVVTSTTKENVGGFVGNNLGTIEKSFSMGSVSGLLDVGGFLGQNSGIVTNCYS